MITFLSYEPEIVSKDMISCKFVRDTSHSKKLTKGCVHFNNIWAIIYNFKPVQRCDIAQDCEGYITSKETNQRLYTYMTYLGV